MKLGHFPCHTLSVSQDCGWNWSFVIAKNKNSLLEQSRKLKGIIFLSEKVKNGGSAFLYFCIADVSSSFELKTFSARINWTAPKLIKIQLDISVCWELWPHPRRHQDIKPCWSSQSFQKWLLGALWVQTQRKLNLQKITEKSNIRLAELTNFLETPLKSRLKLFLFDAEITAVTNIQPYLWFMCSLGMGSVRVAQFSNFCLLPPSSAFLI